MAKIKSNYFNQEFDVVIYPGKNERGDDVQIITHTSLKDVFYNQITPEMKKERGIVFDMQCTAATSDYCMYLCEIKSNDGRVVIECGETRLKDLSDSISRRNAGVIAMNRAFDRAVISFLELPKINGQYGRIFSNAEDITGIHYSTKKSSLSVENKTGSPDVSSKMTDESTTSETMQESQTSHIVPAPITSTEEKEEVPVVSFEPTEMTSTNHSDENQTQSTNEEMKLEQLIALGSKVIQMGRFKGKTISDVYSREDGKTWMTKMIQGLKPNSSKLMQDTVADLQSYLDLQ